MFFRLFPRWLVALVACGGFSAQGADELALPANLGGGLRQLVAAESTVPRARAATAVKVRKANPRVQTDSAGRVVVDVFLDGTVPGRTVRAGLEALGAKVLAFEPAGGSPAARHGVMSVYLPVEQAVAASKLPGVQSLSLVHRPWHRVGLATSRGVVAMKANLVQRQHFTGAGVTIGVLSDSYDLTTPHAAVDAVRDDLPGAGNRAHRTTPVFVLNEGDSFDSANSDEGRAMLQIVHDVAPDAALAFSTTGATQATFAAAVRGLRTNASAHCDVLVDDIGFPDEPFFSDGVAAQAVEDVVNSTALAGAKVIYFSAAGNQGGLGYEADFSAVSDTAARNGQAGTNNLDLTQVPPSLTGGGFHNFTPGNGTQIVQEIVISGLDAEVDFQWNDLFDKNAMTSDFNLLVFDADGNYIDSLSGTDNSFSTGQAMELCDLPPNDDGSDATYQIAIAKRSGGTGTAQHFRYVTNTDGGIGGTFLQEGISTIFGHSGARSGNGVGAYQWNKLLEPEDFSSFGPVTIYFDDTGNRLAPPEVRQQPTVSGPDGVATTVFPVFFGTSASAPHVAGLAALLLQAAGGPNSLDPAQMRTLLENTADRHDVDPLVATANFGTGAGTITLTGHGDNSNFSTTDAHFFQLDFAAPAGTKLQNISIDLSPAGLTFDQNTFLGFPFTIGGTSGDVSSNISTLIRPGARGTRNSRLILTFSDFPAGGSLLFGIDRDLARSHSAGNSADALGRATVSASVLPFGAARPILERGAFINALGTGYTPADGFGFVNASSALQAITP